MLDVDSVRCKVIEPCGYCPVLASLLRRKRRFLAVDVFHHTVTVGAYYVIAAALLYMPHELIKYSMDPKSVEVPDFKDLFGMFIGNLQNHMQTM